MDAERRCLAQQMPREGGVQPLLVKRVSGLVDRAEDQGERLGRRVPGRAVHVNANKREQARFVLDTSRQMAERIDGADVLYNRIRCEYGEMDAQVSRDRSLDGLKPSLWSGDEVSEWRGRFITKLTTSTVGREDALGVLISTPGNCPDLVYPEMVATAETVEWIMPALEDIFSEENGIPEFEPVGAEDEEPAEKMTHLCRYQFWRQSDGTVPLRLAMKKGLMFRPGGIIKYCWETEEEVTEREWADLAPDDVVDMLANPKYEISSMEADMSTGMSSGKGRTRERVYDGPRFYSVSDGEFLRHPNCRDIKTSPFVAHKVVATADELRRKKGKPGWKNIDYVLENETQESTDGSYGEQIMKWYGKANKTGPRRG